MKEIQLPIPKSLYPAQTVLKAAYAFIDTCYIYITETTDNWVVHLSVKDSISDVSIQAKEFKNELLFQAVHLRIYEQTHVIRELLLARAMSSSMILENNQIPPVLHEEEDISDEELKSILVSWFDNNE